MLKKMKMKFVTATMLALILVIGLIIGAINTFNYNIVVDDADAVLELIMDNAGRFPNDFNANDPAPEVNITPESPFESRYFTVVMKDGRIKKIDTASIAAIDDYIASEIANKVLSKGKEKGFIKDYRYMIREVDDEITLVFLDCTRVLNQASTFMFLSILVSVLGVLIVFIMLLIIADKVVTPLAEGYEKQKRFITNAGHDIKTPITIIDADAEILEIEVGDNEWLSDIKKQSKRLATLTSDLIYLSRMDEEAYVAHTDFPISDMLEELAASFAALAKKRQIILDQEITPAIYYNGDENAIKKLFTILLDNAVKYSPEAETVNLSLKKTARGISIKLSNRADNLDEEAMKHLFDRFYRNDPARSSGGGFGIGLSVAYAIVASHKGKITAEKNDDRFIIEVVL